MAERASHPVAAALALLPALAQPQQPQPQPDLEGPAPMSEGLEFVAPPIAAALMASMADPGGPYEFSDSYEVEVGPESHGSWGTTTCPK